MDSITEYNDKTPLQFSLEFEIESTILQDNKIQRIRCNIETDSITVKRKAWGEAYMYTFRDFDGTIHYAVAIPPSNPQSATGLAPVIVALHGAGKLNRK